MIKGKLNNLILVKPVILLHASIFYENIWMFYHFGKIIHKMAPEVYILCWSPGRGWGLIQSRWGCCVTSQSETRKHPRREANRSLLFWKHCLSDHHLSRKRVWPERRSDTQAGAGSFRPDSPTDRCAPIRERVEIAMDFYSQFVEASILTIITLSTWGENRIQLISQIWGEHHFIPRQVWFIDI